VLVNHNTPKGRAAKPAPAAPKRTAKKAAPKRKVAKKK
jgi:hypothetical protein